MSATIKLDTSVLDKLIAQIPGRVEEVLEETAEAIAAEAKKNIRNWPLVDTGALLNSIIAEKQKPGLWSVGDFGGYRKQRDSRFGWRDVSAGMEYAVYWELGHHNLFTRRYMRMPFLGPAIAKEANYLAARIAKDLIK